MSVDPLSKPRILLVDDEPSITAALRISLRKEPWEVATAASAEAGLALLEERPAAVVISDERMPGMTGAAFLAEVARRWPTTQRILLTGQASLEEALASIDGGGLWRCFLKPTNPLDLRLSIAKALEHHELLTESRRLLETARRGRDGATATAPVEPLRARPLLDEIREFNARSSAPAPREPSRSSPPAAGPAPAPAPSAAK